MYKSKSLKFFLTLIAIIGLFSSCSKSSKEEHGFKEKFQKRIVIWTNNSDLIQYVELFNATHDTKAVLVYKSNPAASLPPKNGELNPDIVIGPYLKNSETRSYFGPIDYLFDRKYLKLSEFYPSLIKAGEIFNNHYLLPVSFNLPAIIFSTENKNYIKNNYTITPDQLFETGKTYNQRNKKNALIKIGFSPLSSNEFLYTFARMNNVHFAEDSKNTFTYNEEKLNQTISELKKMTAGENSSIRESNDFVYKYLSVVDTKRVTSGRSLFAYTTSDKLFRLPSEQLAKIDFRWLETEDLIPVEDSMIMMGISRYASNYQGSAEFMTWFFNPSTQKSFLELKKSLTSDIINFGIAGGFSSIREVNEQILPTFYTSLLSNIPQEGSYRIPGSKPVNWEVIKQEVLGPYIKDSILAEQKEENSTLQNSVKSIEDRYSDWKKQNQILN